MKEKPILFSGPMVRALLNTQPNIWPAELIDLGKPYKWMTRRVINPRYKTGEAGFEVSRQSLNIHIVDEEGMTVREDGPAFWPGDILWVRETWQENTMTSEKDKRDMPYFYRADPDGVLLRSWKPSSSMPRKAARLFLEVKAVRIERLWDITDKDVRAEGWPASVIFDHIATRFIGPYCDAASSCTKENKVCSPDFCHDQNCFAAFWNKLNAKRGYAWDSNPWVWVYEFMRVKGHESKI